MEYTIDLIIPVYKPDEKFSKLMERIQKQTIKPKHIFLIETDSSSSDIKEQFGNWSGVELRQITREEFDHGGTRNYGAGLSKADYILFMTQDAVPADKYLIEELLHGFKKEKVGAVYGRQLPQKDSTMIEQYTRFFNYPPEDHVKSQQDLKELGIKTYFCSNVCAMYRRDIYKELGGFVQKTIFNEDMILAAGMIGAGYKIAYASRAKVIHSHHYTWRQQFSRNFDLAVSQRQYQTIFKEVKSQSEGMKLVKKTAAYLLEKKKPWLIPNLIFESGFKYLGYQAGYHYERLPFWLVKKFSMNKAYW